MRVISEVNINVKKGLFPQLVDELYKNGCELNKMKFTGEINNGESFNFEVVYNNQSNFTRFINTLKNSPDKYKVASIVNSLEEYIKGGLLNVTGKMAFENIGDYEMGISGASNLITEKIDELNGISYTGISKNVGLFGGIKIEEDSLNSHLLKIYVQGERDSVLINRFSELNAYPLMINFSQPEDFITTIQRLEKTFSAIRMIHIDEADIFLYDQIYSSVNIPITSYGFDDIPLYLLTVISAIIRNNKLNPGETTIGILGIDISVMRITRLLMKIGCLRVLGYDHNENARLSFENQGELATTSENIFSNADILILVKNNYVDEDFHRTRPGQYIISLLKDDDIDLNVISDRGVRDFIQGYEENISVLFPGLIRGMMDSRIRAIDDLKMINISNKLIKLLSERYSFPDIFSDIHENVKKFLTDS